MAEEYHRLALEIRQKLAPASLTVAASFNNLGLVAELRGDLAKAEDYHRQALDIEQKLAPGSLAVASSFNNLGLVAGDRGDWTKAEKYLRQALEIKLKLAPESLDAANTYAGLGEVAWKRGDLAGAEANHRRALEIREKLAPGSSSHAETLASLAEIMRRKGQPEAAAQLFDQALNAVESQGARLGGSQDIRAGFRAQFDAYYRDYVDLLVEQAQQERAFAVLEHSRARSLLEMLAEAHLDVHEGIDSALLKEERSLHAEIAAKTNRRVSLLTGKHTEEQAAAITKEIEDLIARHQAVQGEIRSSSPGYAALTQPELLNAKEIQLLLDPDTLLLEYSLGAERSHAFAVSTKSMAAFDLPPRKQIEQTARRLYWLMTERNRNIQDETEAQRSQRWQRADAAYNKAAYDLSRMILGPAATQLRGKRLLVVADGALHYIPFAALPDPTAAQTTNHPQQVPLAFNHEIVNLPSASVLAVLRQNEVRPHPAPKVVAVLADPVFTSADSRVRVNAASRVSIARRDKRERNEGALTSDLSATLLTRSAADVGLSHGGRLRLPRLLFSRREADAILAVTPDGLGLKAVDFDANRAMATSPELAQYRIVHFATHGLLDSQHPELSGLVLSLVDQQGRPQDGFLQLQDIYNMNLAADLVVLSACETGLGKEVDGEGLIGLTRGFMYAGATRVVSSLWKISDFATAKLMKAFYTAMEQKGKRPAEALREAQLSLAKDSRWSAPYYWAGFTIQGEWK
jgi:CHAT domain-containing protein/Tfp pilus assembly protein PilF